MVQNKQETGKQLEGIILTAVPIVEKELLPNHPFFADVVEAYGSPIPQKDAVWNMFYPGCAAADVEKYVQDVLDNQMCLVIKPSAEAQEKCDLYIIRHAVKGEKPMYAGDKR